ncbi:cysteine-rich KTR domain-containing protein [Anaerotignum propionicum]|uniref:cysteine-rich KTR domain-containing protein n=1 Tax=Anaerotignum propionicum TaxID=28446 RepID=UPI002FE6CF2B
MDKSEQWILCPICKNKTRLRLYFTSDINNYEKISLPGKYKRKTLQTRISCNVPHSIFCCV